MNQKIWVFSLCRNEADILPFYLRNYSAIAERILVWDDASTDGSRELLQANPKVTMSDWPYPDSGIDEDLFLKFAHDTYPMAAGKADWIMWVDCDELIHSADLIGALERGAGYDVIRPSGWNMTGDGLPKDDGRQLWQISQMGVDAPVYAKPVIVRPTAKVVWNRGKHDVENDPKLLALQEIKLLHYRYMGDAYTRKRNAVNYARVGLKTGDKNAGWSCSPDWHGDHSPEWAEKKKHEACNVITAS